LGKSGASYPSLSALLSAGDQPFIHGNIPSAGGIGLSLSAIAQAQSGGPGSAIAVLVAPTTSPPAVAALLTPSGSQFLDQSVAPDSLVWYQKTVATDSVQFELAW
jgi:hypothetical protein